LNWTIPGECLDRQIGKASYQDGKDEEQDPQPECPWSPILWLDTDKG
jgi:hypothetical protein